MRFLSMAMICLGAFATTPALALHCYTLALKDEAGRVIPVDRSPIGLMIGDNAVIEGDYPPHVMRDPVAPAQCPESLVESIRATFNASCLGDDVRKKTAEENKVPVDVVNKGCSDMDAALQNKDVDYYLKRDKELFPRSQAILPKKPGEK